MIDSITRSQPARAVEVGREGQPALRGGGSLGRQLALGDPARHRLDDAVAQAADVAAAGLHDDHREAGQGGHLRDAGAHQSTADDADVLRFRHDCLLEHHHVDANHICQSVTI
jgi:hypothetical protein